MAPRPETGRHSSRGSLSAWQVKSIINSVKPSTMDLVLWNNSLSLPLLVVLGLLLDDPAGLIASIPSITAHGWMVVIVSFVLAGQIAFAGFMLQAVVSPTSATLINHMVKVCTFVASHMVFHDQFGIWMLVGAVLTLAGTVWYSSEGAIRQAATNKATAGGSQAAASGRDGGTEEATNGPSPNKPIGEGTQLLGNAPRA